MYNSHLMYCPTSRFDIQVNYAAKLRICRITITFEYKRIRFVIMSTKSILFFLTSQILSIQVNNTTIYICYFLSGAYC